MGREKARIQMGVNAQVTIEHPFSSIDSQISILRAAKRKTERVLSKSMAQLQKQEAEVRRTKAEIRQFKAECNKYDKELEKYESTNRTASNLEIGFDRTNGCEPADDVGLDQNGKIVQPRPPLRPAALPYINEVQGAVMQADRQDSKVANDRKRRGEHNGHSPYSKRIDRAALQPVSPYRLLRMNLRVDANDLEKLRPGLTIISNVPPVQGENFDTVQLIPLSIKEGCREPIPALRDSCAMFNVINKRFANEFDFVFTVGQENLPVINIFGKYEVKPIERCWAPIQFIKGGEGFWIEFYVCDDTVMHEDVCILSVKTCRKAGLLLDGLKK